MNKFLRLGPLFFASVVILISCSKEVAEGTDSVEKRVLEAHVKVVYNNTIQPTASGLYIINKKIGTGALVKKTGGVFVRYSTLDLKNIYLSSSLDSVAKVVGGYSDSTYYGPVLFEMGNYTLIRGVEEALLKLREGSKVRLLIPSWLSDYDYQGSTRLYSATRIYDIEVLKVVDSVAKFEIDTLESFSAKHYGGMDSLSRAYYYKSLYAGIGDTLKKGDNISYWYVGKLLDGFVFDTNIEDTARKYNIYNPSRSDGYRAREYTLVDLATENGTDIKGIAKTVVNMKHGGKAITFFSSEWGYSSSQTSFGKFQPLFFYIEVVSDKKDDL